MTPLFDPVPQLTDVLEGCLSLMEDVGEERSDIRVPEGDLGKEIKDRFENEDTFMVTVLSAMGKEAAIGTKNLTK